MASTHEADKNDVVHTEATAEVIGTSSLAAQFEARQHTLTRTEAIKTNIKPLAWCIYMFFVCIGWGFDGLAGGVVTSIAQFRQDFGYLYEGAYVVSADWQLGFTAATLFGLVFGGIVTGFAANIWGRQICIGVGYLVSIAGVFLQVFAKTDAQFFGGKVLTGVPLGCFTTLAPTYASEMAPLPIRGAITAGMNFAIVLGQLIGYGVMRQASFYTGALTYKVLFATQWGFAVVGLMFLPFLPESPYWLISHGNPEKARANLVKLHDADYDVDGDLASIREALARQNQDNESQGTMAECFNKDNWKRTMVATSTFFIQNCCGSSWVIGYMAYFMELAGMSSENAFSTTVGLSGVMVVGNMSGWFFVEKFGRRGTALYGTATLSVVLFVIGILACISSTNAIWGQVACMAVWSFIYQGTIGSAAWPIAAENASSRLRSPTQALSTAMNGLSSCIWSFALPYAINPDQGNLQGKIAFVFGSVLVLATGFIWYFYPETKGRTYVEIDELWKRGVSPRHFARTKIITVSDEKPSN
ncbi:general substrate transporter [Xylariales sp. PMI_506]|nr:general substrate transporter [Xylariales sp. PMI_506]